MEKETMRVLLVEDQQKVIEEIKNEIVSQGFEFSVSGSVERAIFRAKAYHFDLFIVNCGEDGKKGLSFINEVLKETDNKNFKVLFTINPKIKVDVRLRKFNNAFDILRLPVDNTELKIRLDNILHKTEKAEEPSADLFKKQVKAVANPSGKVLLVEDNPLNQKVLGMFISKLGYEYDVASNGQMAVDMCKSTFYPFVLMDIYMPGMDGTEATEKIRENETSSDLRAKIIAITANESEESVKRCYDSGMDDYLVKPFTLETLKEKLV